MIEISTVDGEIRGGGGGGHPGEEAVSKKFFQPFGLQFGLKIRGLPPPPKGPSHGSATETSSKINQGEKCFQSNLPHRWYKGYKSKQLCQGIGCRIGYLPFFCTCRWNWIDELVWCVAERLKLQTTDMEVWGSSLARRLVSFNRQGTLIYCGSLHPGV